MIVSTVGKSSVGKCSDDKNSADNFLVDKNSVDKNSVDKQILKNILTALYNNIYISQCITHILSELKILAEVKGSCRKF